MREDIKAAGKEVSKILTDTSLHKYDENISIVIAVLDSLDYTKGCIDSLMQYAPNAEIIVVNNGSQPDTKQYFDSQKHIKTIHWDTNCGVSKAWNAGLKLATRNILCVLNNDVLVQQNGIQRLISAAMQTGVASVEGACMNMDFSYAYSIYNDYESDYLGGYCLVFRRDVWDTVGEFDEIFSPAYWEDNDWGLRVKQAGYKWKILPGCVIHFVARTSTRVLDMNTFFTEQRKKFVNKWGTIANGLGERILVKCENNNCKEIQQCVNELRLRKPMSKIQILTDIDESSFTGYDCVSNERKFKEYTQEIDCTEYLARPLISFITWVNDEIKYRSFLKSSHKIKAEYIRLGQEYDSMSRAYNAGTDMATGEYLAYVHQDVEILDTMFEEKIKRLFDSKDNLGFVGVIGSLTNDNVKSLWFHEGVHSSKGIVIQNRTEAINIEAYNGPASLLDGLLMITDKRFNFPESLPHIHFVDAWMCNVASKAGYQNWITDILVNHNSGGETNSTFFKDNLIRYRLKWFMVDKWSDILNLEQIKNTPSKTKIGIGITTRNRPEMLNSCLSHMKRFTDESYFKHIVIYDDCSSSEEMLRNQEIVKQHGMSENYYYGKKQVGVSQSKNSCLHLLGGMFDYYFLFDDDAFPVKDGWENLYISTSVQSGVEHLLYSNHISNVTLFTLDGVNYVHPAYGVVLFFTKNAIQKLGGFAPQFGLYGEEHVDMSVRANMCKLSGNQDYIYAAPINCENYIWCSDLRIDGVSTYFDTPNNSHEVSLLLEDKIKAISIAHQYLAQIKENRPIHYPLSINHEILRM